jgi:hypothetical protein
MKVNELFEARQLREGSWYDDFRPEDTVPSQKDKGWTGRHKVKEDDGETYEDLKYEGRILLHYDAPIKTHGLDQAAVKEAYEKAKAKFLEIRAAHPTQLRFKTSVEATKYMKTMEYPGWTLVVQYARLNWGSGGYKYTQDLEYKTPRKVKTLDLPKQEFKPKHDENAINVEMDGDKVKLSIDVKVGPLMSAFITTAYNVGEKMKAKILNVKGRELDYSDLYRSRPQKVWVTTTDLDRVKAIVAKKHTDRVEDEKADHDKLQNALTDRKETSKWRADDQKQRKAKLHAQYGKEIVDRVKIKPMSMEGDDGYQWALFVDGRRKKSGMTKYQAEGEQRIMWRWLKEYEDMTPEQRLQHAQELEGIRLYFMMDAIEKSIGAQLPQYLNAIKKNAKDFVDAKQATKDAIETSKVSDAQAKSIFNDLMKRMGDKLD